MEFNEVAIIASADPEALKEALVQGGTATATVEAEYGDTVVEGSLFTLAHHGPRSGQPAPCLAENVVENNPDIIGVSHLDLDTLGGVLALMGRKPHDPNFWAAAASVDIHGPHKVRLALSTPGCGVVRIEAQDEVRLHAYWAWSAENRLFPPRDGSVLDVTEWFGRAEAALGLILGGDEGALQKGREFKEEGMVLNEASLLKVQRRVALRASSHFVNHLYASPNGLDQYAAVVGFGTRTQSITVSLADPIPGVSCAEFVRSLWGPEAGGHAGIAGSPRNRRMTIEEALEATEKLSELIG